MKGIKTLLGVLAAASLLFSTSAYAQENANRDENGKVVRGAYETNKALDNTFIALGVGYNAGLNFANRGTIPFAQLPGGFAVDLSIGKMWTPFIGARLNYHGWSNNVNGGKFNFNTPRQHFLTVDLLWSMLDSFGGYKETRFWNILPYISGGYARTHSAEGAHNNWIMGAGILNKLYLSSRVSLLLDFRGMVGKASWWGVEYEKAVGRFEFPVSATVGVAFNLGKTNFNRHSSITPVVIPVPFTTDQYNALKDKVAALEKENAELKDKIAALEKELAPVRQLVNGQTYLYENGTFTAVDVKPGAPITLYFDCGSAQLSAREKAHLEYFTSNVLDGDTKLVVNGYADKQSGSARRNQQLSEQRVKTVVDLLTKAGAKEENIEATAHGASVQLFDGSAKNRVVTVEVK